MVELIKETKTTHYVDYSNMENYLSEKIGRRVEIIESANDTDYHLSLKKEKIEDYDKETIDDFLKTGYIGMDYEYHTIFTHCVNEGWLEEGDYVLRVSW